MSEPVCIIPVSVGKAYSEIKSNEPQKDNEDIFSILSKGTEDAYGYSSPTYEEPLCKFTDSSVGLIITMSGIYNVSSYKLQYVTYSLGNANDYYHANCLPLSSEDKDFNRFVRGKNTIKLYCVLPNLDYLMDSIHNGLPQNIEGMQVPMYVRVDIEDNNWERSNNLTLPFKFVIENSYATLTNELNSVKKQKEFYKEQMEKINKIARRVFSVLAVLTGMDVAFGCKWKVGGKLSSLFVSPAFCAVHRATCDAETCTPIPGIKHATCGVCASIGKMIDHAWVCTAGGAGLLTYSMNRIYSKLEPKYNDLETKLEDIESKLDSSDAPNNYNSYSGYLNDQYSEAGKGIAKYSTLKYGDLAGALGLYYSTACTVGSFKNIPKLTGIQGLSSSSILSNLAVSAVTTGINQWALGGGSGKGFALSLGSAVVSSIGGSFLASSGEVGEGVGRAINLFTGTPLGAIITSFINKPKGGSDFLSNLALALGSWSFGTGISAGVNGLYDLVSGWVSGSRLGDQQFKIIKDEKGNLIAKDQNGDMYPIESPRRIQVQEDGQIKELTVYSLVAPTSGNVQLVVDNNGVYTLIPFSGESYKMIPISNDLVRSLYSNDLHIGRGSSGVVFYDKNNKPVMLGKLENNKMVFYAYDGKSVGPKLLSPTTYIKGVTKLHPSGGAGGSKNIPLHTSIQTNTIQKPTVKEVDKNNVETHTIKKPTVKEVDNSRITEKSMKAWKQSPTGTSAPSSITPNPTNTKNTEKESHWYDIFSFLFPSAP